MENELPQQNIHHMTTGEILTELLVRFEMTNGIEFCDEKELKYVNRIINAYLKSDKVK
jgi:hypothetical protein